MTIPRVHMNQNALQRRQLLAQHNRSSSTDSNDDAPRSKTNGKFGELSGGTTADVTAVCCCFPCGVANLVVLAIYKVPAGQCRKALRKKQLKKLHKKGMLQPHFRVNDHDSLRLHDYFQDADQPSGETDKAAIELENEMWDKFYGTGFWRNPSQHEGETL